MSLFEYVIFSLLKCHILIKVRGYILCYLYLGLSTKIDNRLALPKPVNVSVDTEIKETILMS